MLPVSIAGIGTRDGFLILYLGQAGISKEMSIWDFDFVSWSTRRPDCNNQERGTLK